MLRLLVACFLCLATVATAQAAERRMLDAEEALAFHGVGRLNIAGSRFCTATLIAPDVIVTAAHCLFHPQTGKRVPESELRFVAGYRLRERAAVRRVVATAIDPAYAFGARATYAGVGADLALARLDAPVPTAVVPFATADRQGDGTLSIVSYGEDRPHAPSVEAPCGIVDDTDPVLALDCAVTYGASGSPLFEGEPGDLRLVGVVSAMGRLIRPPVDVTFTVLLGDAIASLRAALAAVAPPRPRP